MRRNKHELRATLRAEEGADPIDMETEADVQAAIDAENDLLLNGSPFEWEWPDYKCETPSMESLAGWRESLEDLQEDGGYSLGGARYDD